MESLDESNVLLHKLLIWLKNPFEKDIEINVSPQVSAISEILQGYITLLHKFGLTISYKDTIDLESAWACHESEKTPVCSEELRYWYPGVAIIDNDDFREDTLTGGGTSHRTNMMFLQSSNLDMPRDSTGKETITILTKETKQKLAAPQKHALPYKTAKCGNPVPHPEFNTDTNTSNIQRRRSFLHALIIVPVSGEELCPSEQKIGAYSGFQANIYDSSPKGKAYYYMIHFQPPNKTVVHEMMCRSVAAAD